MLFLMRQGSRLARRGAVAAILVGSVLHAAQAQIIDPPQKPPEAAVLPPAATEAAPAAPVAAPVHLAKPYYIEFRARSAHNYGHTFSIYGRLNAQGKILTKTVAGLHPATESPVPWMIGHFVAVPSETGASDGDLEDQYVTARFHVALTADEYKRVVGFIKSLQAKSPVWHAVAYNCSAFVGDIAKFMGMEAPPSMLMPAAYIDTLKEQNIGKTGLIGTPTKVISAEALRALALKTGGRPSKETPAAAAAPEATVAARPHAAPAARPQAAPASRPPAAPAGRPHAANEGAAATAPPQASAAAKPQATPAARPPAAPAVVPQAASQATYETTGHAPPAAAPKPAKPAQQASAVKPPEPKPIEHTIH